MAENTPPLYGRLELNETLTLEQLAERFLEVSENFLANQPFSAYLTPKEGRSLYGLELQEALELIAENEDKFKNAVFSVSSAEGRGVRFNLQLGKPISIGKYFIASGHSSISEQMDEILQGIWTPRENEATSEPEPEPILPLAEAVPVATVDTDEVIKSYRSKFQFDPYISPQQIFQLINKISSQFLKDAPFNVRVATSDGDLLVDQSAEKLSSLFDEFGHLLHTLYLDAGTVEGHLVDIRLNYLSGSGKASAEIQIFAPKGEQIQNLITDTLKLKALPEPFASTYFSRFVSIKKHPFNEDAFANLIMEISHDYFHNTSPTVSLSTRDQETYEQISISQFQQAYQKHGEGVREITVQIRQAVEPFWFYFNLKFIASSKAIPGFIQIFTADQDINEKIFSIIQTSMPLSSQEELGRIRTLTLQHNNQFFANETIPKQKDDSCLVIMPRDAYWSDPLWDYISDLFKGVNISALKAKNIFSRGSQVDNWAILFESEWVLADLTYKTPDVFYKLGVAHSLGKKILLISQHDRDIPLDFRDTPHIVYNNTAEGLEELGEKIIAVFNAANDS